MGYMLQAKMTEHQGTTFPFRVYASPVVPCESDRRSDVVPSLVRPKALTLTKYVPIPRSKDPLGTVADR
jgi:hypothetical protein